MSKAFQRISGISWAFNGRENAETFQSVFNISRNPEWILFTRYHCNALAQYQNIIQPAREARERASRARAVTVSQCPHSEVGQDFLLRRRVTPTETAVTRKRKVEKWIRRCQNFRLREGYKRAIDEIRGPIAKN